MDAVCNAMTPSRSAPDRTAASVSAVVLTIGETTTDRAIESVKAQTLNVAETVVIRDEAPFHKALNQGAARVRTEFFVQVDADMVLDPGCVEALLACADENVGIVAGHLRDPLVGRTCCIKLFRTACFQRAGFPDSISPDTDFIREIAEQGSAIVYAVRFDPEDPARSHTFGQHDPDYTLEYTFLKHLLEGRRYIHRDAFPSCRWHIWQLERNRSEASLAAQVAIAQGLFLESRGDGLTPLGENGDREFLESIRALLGRSEAKSLALLPTVFRCSSSSLHFFERHYCMGTALGRHGSARQIRRWFWSLGGRHDVADVVAKIAFCHGLFQQAFSAREGRAKGEYVKAFLADSWPARSSRQTIRTRIAEAREAFRLLFR